MLEFSPKFIAYLRFTLGFRLLSLKETSMDVRIFLFIICSFPDGALQNRPSKHPKVSRAIFFSIDFHYNRIEVNADIRINLS